MSAPVEIVIVGLGGNIEPRLDLLRQAVAALGAMKSTRLLAVSPVYESEPWGAPDQPDFLNAAASIETSLAPLALLDALLAIEARLGRDRSDDARRWGPRTIDLDILLIQGCATDRERIVDRERLTVPHPRLRERDFALRPLLDLLPDAVDPRDGTPLRDCLASLGASTLTLFAEARDIGGC